MPSFSVPVEHIKAALAIAPDSDVRYYMNGVCFDFDGKRVLTVATDGHRLIVARWYHEDAAVSARAEYIIPRGDLEDAIRKVKGYTHVNIEVDGASVKIYTTARTVLSSLVDAKYPDWRRVVPKETSGTPAQYAPDYIFDFHRVSRLFSKRGMIYVSYNGLSPAIITFPDTADVVGVLMPYRLDENEAAITMLREVA